MDISINLPLISEGKVRKIYQADDDHLLIITTDRISAFDVVLPTPIPNKGVILTQVANFWFEQLKGIIPHHLADVPLSHYLPEDIATQLANRTMVVKKLKPLPIEAIVRGYLVGSGWNDYQQSGKVCGIDLPSGLKQAEKLPEVLFTPSTKASIGDHGENIDFAGVERLIGTEKAQQVADVSIKLYQTAADYAAKRGIIIADTKFEFGEDHNGNLYLIDEVLTPDSSRFWPADTYCVGQNPPSFDKQFVRDYLSGLDWDKTPPGPELPEQIVNKTAQKYQEVATLLTAAK